MGNGEVGKNIWQIMKDVIQVLILPIMFMVWSHIDSSIEKNAEKLEKIENNQIRVISTVGMLEDELQRLEVEHEKASSERARVHHTSSKSCLECKVQGMEHYPAQLKPKNSFAK